LLGIAAAAAERQHARYHPSPDLETCVEHYWSVQWDLRGLPPQRVETLPHPSVHMVFEHHAGATIAGVTRGKFSRLLRDAGGVFGVKFKPGGFYPFAARPVSTFTDSIVGLRSVFGAAGAQLERAMRAETADDSRIVLIEDFLRGRRAPPDENVSRLAAMVYAVAADRSIRSVEDLVGRYGLNKRTLQRLFAKYVGVSAKWVIQRYRLHEAAEGIRSQSALALQLGYSDQAHFVRDFKRVVGTPPAAYAKSARTPRP
jgi:AraC-like DNA-binding protein